jgi:hypothetical protein
MVSSSDGDLGELSFYRTIIAEMLFDQNIFIHKLSAIRSIAFNRY